MADMVSAADPALAGWPYPFHLSVTGIHNSDIVADVSDEEGPAPGKFLGGKNGKFLRPWKKYKLTPATSSAADGDEPMEPVEGGSPTMDELAGQAARLGQDDAPTPDQSNATSASEPTHRVPSTGTVQCCVSQFGLPPTLLFQHTQLLSQNLPPTPNRFQTSTLSVLRNNSSTGLYYRIGPGAVAFRAVLNIFNQSGLTHTYHPTRWNVLWAKRVAAQEWATATEYQKINHFPGTRGIARKDSLAKNLLRIKRQHPDSDFTFAPNSYIVPQEMQNFEADFRRNGGMWILKPAASSCGKGIRLIDQLPVDLGPKAKKYDGKDPVPSATWVLQQYIDHPMLVEGFKFDLRVYVLVTSFDPLRVYVFNEGLVRFATEKYKRDSATIGNAFMHLTNYSLNKHSETYITPAAAAKAAALAREARARAAESGEGEEEEEEGAMETSFASKWTLAEFIKYCLRQGIDWSAIQAQMYDIIIKTLISVEAETLKELRTKCRQPQCCFELFGWDLMLDKNLKMYLIEVNLMPSLSCTTALDKAVKYALIEETLTLAGAMPYHRALFDSREHTAKNRHPRFDDITFQEAAQLKATMARLSDTSKPLTELLTPEQRLVIMESEDELTRRGHFTRIFPTSKAVAKYMKFFEGPRPNIALLGRWEKEKKKGLVTLDMLRAPKAKKPRRPSKG